MCDQPVFGGSPGNSPGSLAGSGGWTVSGEISFGGSTAVLIFRYSSSLSTPWSRRFLEPARALSQSPRPEPSSPSAPRIQRRIMTIAPMPTPINRQSAKVLSRNACTGRPPELGRDEGGVVRHTRCVPNGQRTPDYGRWEWVGSRMISALKRGKTAPISLGRRGSS